MMRKRVAIIGAGFSGVAVAAHLAARAESPDVTLIEREKTFARGLAYGTSDDQHVLNVRAARMSAFAHAPDHFAHWLKRKTGAPPTAFASRKRYGAYIEDVLHAAERKQRGGLKRVRGDAVACVRIGDGWRVTLANGEALDADAVVLATGHCPPAALPAFARSGVAMLSAWDTRALKRLPKGDILLVGTGLTMIDAALTLSKLHPKATLYALSRRGLTPRPHLDPPRTPTRGAFDLPLPLSESLRAFRAEVRDMGARGEPWQLALDRLRHETPALWAQLTPEMQRRFLRHVRPWWDVHRHRTAPDIAAKVEALKAAGRLRVLAGEVASVTAHRRSIEVMHRQRGSLVRHRLHVAGVVNCTGGEANVLRASDQLMQQLLRDGLVRPHSNGIGLDLDAQGRVVSADGGMTQTLFAIGPLSQGAYWESVAVPELRERAAAIAALL